MGENNIVTIQMDVSKVLDDMYGKIKVVLSKYGSNGTLPPLPEYNTMARNADVYYKFYSDCLKAGDEITYLMVSLSLVLSHLSDIKNTKLTRDLSNQYQMIQNFKKFLDSNLEILTNHKFDLIELKRQLTDRLKLLQNINFL